MATQHRKSCVQRNAAIIAPKSDSLESTRRERECVITLEAIVCLVRAHHMVKVIIYVLPSCLHSSLSVCDDESVVLRDRMTPTQQSFCLSLLVDDPASGRPNAEPPPLSFHDNPTSQTAYVKATSNASPVAILLSMYSCLLYRYFQFATRSCHAVAV